MDLQNVKLIECPRDAMQGWPEYIPTGRKVLYLNALLRVGFDTLDFGSFVSGRAIPQMADTHEVVRQLDLSGTKTRLLAIVANLRGAEEAAAYDSIRILGFPFSVSETFQQRNTHSSVAESLDRVQSILECCLLHHKELVIYLSMGFGNPYGDPYSEQIVYGWAERLVKMGIRTLSLADTVGLASPDQVFRMTDFLVKALPETEIGVHLHARPGEWKPKIEAALRAGCHRFDGSLRGIGGCPMANDDLVGNVDSVEMIGYFKKLGRLPELNEKALEESIGLANEIFTH